MKINSIYLAYLDHTLALLFVVHTNYMLTKSVRCLLSTAFNSSKIITLSVLFLAGKLCCNLNLNHEPFMSLFVFKAHATDLDHGA